MTNSNMTRRVFLYAASAISTTLTLPLNTLGLEPNSKKVRFGLITDLHQDIMHDAVERVSAFVQTMENEHMDFICQVGDFCIPKPENQAFLNAFQNYSGKHYHVIGNHDMDGGFTREQTVAYYGMPHKHYSFDSGGIHFVVLDGNDPGGKRPGYACHIGIEQAAWLADDLHKTELPCIIFSHQPIDDTYGGIESSAEIQGILDNANKEAGSNKVLACFSGHLHRDYVRQINGIYYCQINSASYHWLGSEYKHQSYSKEIHKAHPYIEFTAPYQEPLWAVVTLDLVQGVLEIKGKQSQWVGASPEELKINSKGIETISPKISGWRIPVG